MWGAGAVLGALRELWPVLAGLTVIEGVTWVAQPGGLGQGLLGSGVRRRGPGLRWAALGPLDRAYSWPLEGAVFGPERAHVRTTLGSAEAGRFRADHHTALPYSEPVAEEPPFDSAAVASAVRELAHLDPPARRRALATAAGARLDETTLPRRKEALGQPWGMLRTSAATAFTGLLVAPFLLYKPGLPVTIVWPLLAGFLALHLATAAAGELTLRGLSRQGLPVPRGARLGLWCYPPANLRAVTTLSKELAHGLDPLAVLAAEGAPGELEAALATELHGIEQALSDLAGDDDWRAAWTVRREALEAFLARHGLDRVRLLAPPERADPQASHYCPFCAGEFLPGPTECPACRATLVPFAPAQSTGTKQPRKRRKSPKL